jgi:hypothetical protein
VVTGPHLSSERALAAVVLVTVPALSGCLCFPTFTRATSGALLPDCATAVVRPGATGREVLECLGPPIVVVRQGDGTLPVPEIEYRRSGGLDVPAASFFARFTPEEVAPGDIVYFYREHLVATDGSGVVIVAYVGETARAEVFGTSARHPSDDRLWILVDGVTGRVKAHRLEQDRPGEDRQQDPAPQPQPHSHPAPEPEPPPEPEGAVLSPAGATR